MSDAQQQRSGSTVKGQLMGAAVIVAILMGVGYYRFTTELTELTAECSATADTAFCGCFGDGLRAEFGALRGAAAYAPMIRLIARPGQEKIENMSVRALTQCNA